jgi:hypothetical protein
MSTFISSSSLIPGGLYHIVDGQTGPVINTEIDLYLIAISTTQLEKAGRRFMWVPKTVYENSIWNRTATSYAINTKVVFGNRVYKNLTGLVGTVHISLLALDSTNWELQPWTTTDYVKKSYPVICYDVETFNNFHIAIQSDGLGNLVNARNFNNLFSEGANILSLPGFQNTIDVNDWNNSDIKDNVTAGIWGNACINNGGQIVDNRCAGTIIGNSGPSTNRRIYSNYTTCIYNNTNATIGNNKVGENGINQNTSFSIEHNNVSRGIFSNTVVNINRNFSTYITGNICLAIDTNYVDAISDNTNTGYNISQNKCAGIVENSNGGDISLNTGGGIFSNSIFGYITENITIAGIYNNTFPGNITNNNVYEIALNQ